MRPEMPAMMPVSPMVKRLIIVNAAVWILGIMLSWVSFDLSRIYEWFGFVPIKVMNQFWIWQFFSYMFVHSSNVFHLVFNMLLLWMLGSELEIHWGRRFFLTYYFGCGVGAAILYFAATILYFLISGQSRPLLSPVVGASGAIFGLILAYGMIYGERIIYFMMIFPMKAKIFVMIIGGIEVLNLMSEGFNAKEANLAHLGGIVSGFLILKAGPRIRDFMVRRQTKAYGRKLKLVVDNDSSKGTRGGQGGPKYWN